MTLRAAAWLRESTRGQMDNFGPEAQRTVIAAAIAEHGWIDTGIEYLIAHSGLSVHQTRHWTDMLAAAGRDWDVLVIGRINRLARRVRSQIEAVEAVTDNGGAVYFARERLLSSDPHQWKTWMDGAVTAEEYSRNLSRDASEGYSTRWLTTGIPGGRPPLGLIRTNGGRTWEHDPETVETVRQLFADYGTGNYSQADLAVRYALAEDRVEEMLKNDAYIGVSRYKGNPHPNPAPWAPIIDPATFERVQTIRASKARGGGSHRSRRPDMLGSLLHHECGRYIRRDGTAARRNGSTYAQRLHTHSESCATWGAHARRAEHHFTEPLKALLRSVTITDESLVKVAELVRPVRDDLEPRRIARERARLAKEWSEGRITLEELGQQEAALRERQESRARPTISPEQAAEWLRQLRVSLALIEAATPDAAPEAWSALAHGLFEKVTAQDDGRLALRLSQAAWDHGLAPYLLEASERTLEWRARPDSNRRSPA